MKTLREYIDIINTNSSRPKVKLREGTVDSPIGNPGPSAQEYPRRAYTRWREDAHARRAEHDPEMIVYNHPRIIQMAKDAELVPSELDLDQQFEIGINGFNPNLKELVKRGWVRVPGSPTFGRMPGAGGGPEGGYYKHPDADRLLKDFGISGTQFSGETLEIYVKYYSTAIRAELEKRGWRTDLRPPYKE